jgi:hypothetical protein
MSTEKETALVTIEPTTALAVFTDIDKADAILAKIKKIVAEFKGDVSTAKGRKEIASMAYKVARSKTYVEEERKKLADYHKALPKKIDATGRHFWDEFEKLQDEVRKPLTDWEEAEKARVQGIKARIADMHDVDRVRGFEASLQVQTEIARIEGIVIDESFAEFAGDAAIKKDLALTYLRDVYTGFVRRELEAAELARLREEAAKREAEDRDRRIAEEAAAKARKDAEEKAAREKAEAERKAKEERDAAERRELELKLAAERAEREKREAIEKAERDAQAAILAAKRQRDEEERRRQEEVARANAEADRRAADLANRERIHAEIRDYLMSEGLPQSNAAAVVSLLSTGSIPHVEVRY